MNIIPTNPPDLPRSSPFRRSGVRISRAYWAGYPDPIYLVPMGDRVALTSSEDVLVVVSVGDVQQLHAVLQEALEAPGQSDDPAAGGAEECEEGRYEAVLLEERELLAELKRLGKQAPDLIADFKAGDLSIDDQANYATRLMHTAEMLLIHATAREWVAER